MADKRDNLIVSANFPPEERKRRARIAGKASAAARKKKKSMKEAMDLLLQQEVSNQSHLEILDKLGVPDTEANNQMLMLASAFMEAVNGNVKAMEFIACITGSKAMSEIDKERIKLEKAKLKLEKKKLEAKNPEKEIDDGVVIINDL